MSGSVLGSIAATLLPLLPIGGRVLWRTLRFSLVTEGALRCCSSASSLLPKKCSRSHHSGRGSGKGIGLINLEKCRVKVRETGAAFNKYRMSPSGICPRSTYLGCTASHHLHTYPSLLHEVLATAFIGHRNSYEPRSQRIMIRGVA